MPQHGFLPAVTDALYVDQFVLEVAVDLDASDTPSDPNDVTGGGTVGAGTDPAEGISLCGASTPIAWVELTPSGSSTTYRFAKVPINIGSAPKEPRVASFGKITRAMSLPNDGQYRGAQVTTTLIDHDRILRGLEDSDSLVGSRIAYYLSTETAMRAGSTPRRVFDGVVTDSEPQPGLQFQLQVTDYLSTLLDGATQTYPQRLFTLTDFPGMSASPDAEVPGNPAMLNKSVPVAYGLLSDESLGTSNAQGVVPGIFTGMRQLPGYGTFNFYEFVFFGHASAGVQSYFLPTGPLSTSSVAARQRYVPGVDENQADYILYGTPSWDIAFGSGAPPYRDFNGRRYFVAYGLGPRALLNATGQVPLLMNAGGIEDVGDGSGVLIDGLFRQILHFFINFVLNNYQSGTWLSSPVVPGDLFSRIKTSTFEALQTLSESYVTGGFQGAFLLGANGEGLAFKDLIAKVALNSFSNWYQNADGQLALSVIDPLATLNRSIRDVTDVIQQTFTARRRRDQIANRVPYFYGKRYSPPLAQATPDAGSLLPTATTVQPNPDWAVSTQTTQDAASLAKYGDKPFQGPNGNGLELDMIRDADTAEAIANLTQATLVLPPVEDVFTERLCGCDTELGDRDELTHFEGLTASGYVDRSMRCELHTLDLDALDVEKQYRDLGLLDFSALEV